MAWFAVYRLADGELVSTGTVIADPLPEGLAAKEIDGDPAGLVWNAAALQFEAPPPPDLSQVMVDTDAILHALGPALRFTLWSNADPRVQYFAYCLGAMNNVRAAEVVSSLDLVESLGIIDSAKRAALVAALIPEG
jgi:hypothetical protein